MKISYAAVLLLTTIAASPAYADLTLTVYAAPYSTALGEPITQVPSNVQVVRPDKVADQDDVSVGDLLEKNIDGVNINDTSGNPYQPDINYHGFTASPLLGTAIGLSVYQDGVRVNEPFGDVVNWDLIPENAVASTTLVPGSNPLYGLNTLGGAIAIQTKDGLNDPGTHVQMEGGSWGRRSVEGESGGSNANGVNWFAAGNDFAEDGWRDQSPSWVRQAFGKVGWRGGSNDLSLTFTGADNFLSGLGYIPQSFIGPLGSSSIYTSPDSTENRLGFLTAKGGHWFDNKTYLSTTTYLRFSDSRTSNGDVNDSYDETSDYPYGNIIGGTDYNQSMTTRGVTQENGAGISEQFSNAHELFGYKNLFDAGVSYDYAGIGFDQYHMEGALDNNREAVDSFSEVPQVDMHGSSQNAGIFASNNIALVPSTHMIVSGRYNFTDVTNEDDLNASGPDSLSGHQDFRSFNPAIGLTHDLSHALNIYGGFNQGSRAPSAVEMGCSNPASPCALPNALAGDPPVLKQVIARTWEGGLRGQFDDDLTSNVGIYRTVSGDDIQFIASNTTGSGYFTNVGNTQRQGIDANVAKKWDRFKVSLGYSFVDARYESPFQIANEDNVSSFTNANGVDVIQVNKGDQIPGIPRQQLKLRGEWKATPAWTWGADMQAFSGQYLHGNENNADPSGKIPGYGVVNLDTRYTIPHSGWRLFASVNNLFNTHYENAGLLGENNFYPNGSFRTDGSTTTEPFVSPGSPLAIWVGISYQFGTSG